MTDKKNDFSNMIATVRPTTLGKPKADMSLDVRKAATKLFRVEDGKVHVPRKRATSEQWPEWFTQLEAPTVRYFYVPDEDTQIEVAWNETKELYEDEEGNQYTHERVVEMANPDGREVEGTMEALQALRNAITRFNGKTGKRLATRFVKAQRDSSGRTVRQTEMVYRLK